MKKKPSTASGAKSVLLVDDSAVIRSAYSELLRLFGFQVLKARSGADALRVLASAAAVPDLLLTDFIMPGMTGVELALQVRKQHPRMPVLLFSAYPEYVEHAAQMLPFATCMLKATNPDKLMACVYKMIGQDAAPAQP